MQACTGTHRDPLCGENMNMDLKYFFIKIKQLVYKNKQVNFICGLDLSSGDFI